MADVKYCIREFTPTQNQVGMSHTFYAQTTAEPSDSDEPTVTPGGGDDPNAGND